MRQTGNSSQIGALNLAIVPEGDCRFESSPARSIHAALVRRLELLDPELSDALHDAYPGSSSSPRPWTVSPLRGDIRWDAGHLAAFRNATYVVRVTALVPLVLEAINAAFDVASPLGREPLVLEHVPFHVVPENSYWDGLGSYASLLMAARPNRRIKLEFRSPTAFRSQGQTTHHITQIRCIQGYLTKWNAFADVELPEEALHEYIKLHTETVRKRLSPKTVLLRPGQRVTGVVGRVVWESDGESPAMLRLVNALVDYAAYCGTGISTAQGLGETRHIL